MFLRVARHVVLHIGFSFSLEADETDVSFKNASLYYLLIRSKRILPVVDVSSFSNQTQNAECAVMKRKEVSYDVGRVMGFNWRPHFYPKIVD